MLNTVTTIKNKSTNTSKWPSDAQIKAAVVKMEKIIKQWIDNNDVTYEQLDANLIKVTFKPDWSDKEFSILYSYTFKNFERHTLKFLVSGFLDAKNNELKFEYLK